MLIVGNLQHPPLGSLWPSKWTKLQKRCNFSPSGSKQVPIMEWTVLPCEDGGNFQDTLGRTVETSLRFKYSMVSAQCTVRAVSWEVSWSLRGWITQIQHDIDAGVTRHDILDAFKNVSLDVDFLYNSAYYQVTLSSIAMTLSTAGRWSMWFKPWKADFPSTFNLCRLPFESGPTLWQRDSLSLYRNPRRQR